jgi:hypothetical protein
MLLSQNEADRLDAFVRAWGLTRSDVVRRVLRETELPVSESRPVRHVGRDCETCGAVVHFREDIDGPWYCAAHERRRPRVVSIAKVRRTAR